MAMKSGWLRRFLRFAGLYSEDPQYETKKREADERALESRKASLEFHPGHFDPKKLLPVACFPGMGAVDRVRCDNPVTFVMTRLAYPGGWEAMGKSEREDAKRLRSVGLVTDDCKGLTVAGRNYFRENYQVY